VWVADLNRLFGNLDRLDAPASWSEVKRRKPGPPPGQQEPPRRIVQVVVGLAVAAAGISLALRALFPLAPGRPAAPSTLAGSDILEVPPRGEVDAAFLGDGHPVFVVHHEDGAVSVIDAFSTHRPWGLLELLGWCPLSRTFDESAHGAKFNEYGEYLVGPASADLGSYEVEPADGRVRVRSAVVPTTRSEDARVGFQGEKLCEGAGSRLLLHRIPSSAAFDSPLAAVKSSPEGWIALEGVLLVRAGEPALLCATFEDGLCTSPARVEGINSEPWLDFLHRSRTSLESGWIARVEGDHIANLTRAVVG
jgi:hypothetical protein